MTNSAGLPNFSHVDYPMFENEDGDGGDENQPRGFSMPDDIQQLRIYH